MNFRDVCIPGLLCAALSTFGQAPVISNVDRYTDGTGRRITIAGSNFGTTQGDITVYFGAQKGTVESVANQVIEVSVPPGATVDFITVTNTNTGLTGYSDQQFRHNYGGKHPFDKANLVAPQEDFNGETGLYDLCLCDLDGDGKTDIATANDKDGQNLVSLFRNNSTGPGDIDFIKTTISIGSPSLHLACGDLNGDGKKDLAVAEGGSGERVFILKNNSTVGSLVFVIQSITLAGKLPKRIEINDLDLDGKADLIVTDQKNENKNVLVVPNTSTSIATISFGTAKVLTIPASPSSSDGLAVHDLNGDQLPEIVVTQFQTTNSNAFVFRNESSQGNLNFPAVTTLPLSAAPVNLRIGNLNGDSKPDLAATQLLGNGITTFVNESTAEEIKFAAGVPVVTDDRPWGIDLGDLDGDGKLDVVVASISATAKAITILNNTSGNTGPITFSARQSVPTTFITRHVRIGDLDGDGKPDIALASVDDASVAASKISIFRNKSCIVPTINPAGPLVVCSGFPLPLKATVSSGATYQWKKGGSDIAGATSATFTPTDVGVGQYSVAITSDGCTETSANTQVEVVTIGSVPAPTMTEDSPKCVGSTLNLTAVSAGADGYQWTGPAGFTATGTAVTRTDFRVEHAGRYEVNVLVGTCIAQQGFVVAEAVPIPDFRVGFTGSDLICTGQTKVLSVDPADPNFTYQWFESTGGEISGATATTHTVSASGEYFYKAQYVPIPTCPTADSEHSVLRVVTLPTVAFTSPAQTCRETVVTFTNQSTLEDNAGANFLWEFGDATTSTETSPTHTYQTTGNLNVKLTAAYRGNACAASLTKPISVTALPTANIITEGNVFEFCPGDKLVLAVDQTFTSYLWSTSATTPTIEVSTGGTYSVQLTNSIGCKIQPSKAVTLLTSPTVVATATPTTVNIGETTQLSATPGLASYLWTPPETLNNATIANPVASPLDRTTYVVTATDAKGCTAEAQVDVEVTFEDRQAITFHPMATTSTTHGKWHR
jgi:PKD repeat protein